MAEAAREGGGHGAGAVRTWSFVRYAFRRVSSMAGPFNVVGRGRERKQSAGAKATRPLRPCWRKRRKRK